MCKLLELSLRLRNKKWWFSRVLGNVLIQIPVLYSKWIEFSIRKVQLPNISESQLPRLCWG